MTRLRNALGEVGRLWRGLNIWAKAFAVWTVLGHSFYWDVMNQHANSPGPYRAPHKVAVRKTIVAVRGLGSVVLFGMALFVGTRKEQHETEAKQ
jgi:hypothetical protein